MTDLGSKNPLQLAHSGYQDAKILGTKVWGGSLDFDISFFEAFKNCMWFEINTKGYTLYSNLCKYIIRIELFYGLDKYVHIFGDLRPICILRKAPMCSSWYLKPSLTKQSIFGLPLLLLWAAVLCLPTPAHFLHWKIEQTQLSMEPADSTKCTLGTRFKWVVGHLVKILGNLLSKGSHKKKTIESVIMIIPDRGRGGPRVVITPS